MKHDPKVLIYDAKTAAENVIEFTRELTFEDYLDQLIVRSAVERQFEIIGEILVRLARTNLELANQIEKISDIIQFRNVIAHSYDILDHDIVWNVIIEDLPQFIQDCQKLLDSIE